MIKSYLSSVNKSKSLTAQIRDAEQKILLRNRGVGFRADMLIKKIHQEMTAPSTLLLTVGIGFIIGELTKRQTSNNRGTANKQRTLETSPLRTALNLLASVHTLYTALPIVWMVKFFHKPHASGRQPPERQSQPISTACDAASNRCRSRQ
jgi:hypothetical protein